MFIFVYFRHDVIPIVMGGSPSDYRRAAPPHSFIHVDDFDSPSALAEYLKHLDQNEDLYNEYFLWKGTGSFINTFFWCRICSLLHDVDSRPPSWFSDVDNWWRGPHVCIGKESWRNKSMELSWWVGAELMSGIEMLKNNTIVCDLLWCKSYLPWRRFPVDRQIQSVAAFGQSTFQDAIFL